MISACLEANTHAKKCLLFGQKHNGSDDDRKCEKGGKNWMEPAVVAAALL